MKPCVLCLLLLVLASAGSAAADIQTDWAYHPGKCDWAWG